MGDAAQLRVVSDDEHPWSYRLVGHDGSHTTGVYVLRFHGADAGLVSFMDEVALPTFRVERMVAALNEPLPTHPSVGR